MRHYVENHSPNAFAEDYWVVTGLQNSIVVRTGLGREEAWSIAARLSGEPLARLSYRGATQKIVQVYGLTDDHDDGDVLAIALPVAGESKSSIFGWRVSLWGHRAIVTLNTD